MAKIKEVQMAMEDFINAGREALDALEDLMHLFPAAGVEASSGSTRFPEASGKLAPSAASPLSSETHSVGLSDEETKETGTPAATLEDVRGILAEKARTGFRAEVKALLTAFGAKQLSDITDPTVLSVLLKEAEKIGVVDV